MKRSSAILVILLVLFCAVASFPGIARADYDARDYIAAPPGTNLLVWYYYNTTGHEFYTDSKRASNEVDLKQNIGIFRYVRYFQTGSFTTFGQILAPFGSVWMDGAGVGGVETGTSGIGDVIPSAGIFLINNPTSKTYLGFTEYISVPTGDYQHEKAINMGSDRFGFKSELGFSQGFGLGFNLDLGAAIEFYTDNADYTAASLNLKQDPLYTLEAHLSKDITKDLYGAVEYFYHSGGKTKVNDVETNYSNVSQHQVQLATGYHFTQNFHGLVSYKTTVATENGVKADTFGVRFVYAF